MVDEIDLLLHPKWQMKVIRTVAKALPRMQFIFSSHSPLVASSLEWMNINLLKLNPKTNRTVAKRLMQSIHGLDADQVLLTDFFGLMTTRAASKRRKLDELARRAPRCLRARIAHRRSASTIDGACDTNPAADKSVIIDSSPTRPTRTEKSPIQNVCQQSHSIQPRVSALGSLFPASSCPTGAFPAARMRSPPAPKKERSLWGRVSDPSKLT